MKKKSVRRSKRNKKHVNKKHVNKKHVNKKRVNLSNKNNIKRGKNTLQKKKKTIKKNRNKNLFKYDLPHELSLKYKIVNLINTKKFIQVGGEYDDWVINGNTLGQGGWGTVYKVKKRDGSGEIKAMKVVSIPLENGDDLEQKFDYEVDIMKKMNIKVYDKGKVYDYENNFIILYVVMSRFNGGNLKEAIEQPEFKKTGKIEIETGEIGVKKIVISSNSESMRTIFRDIAVNIKKLYDMEIAHNDIKLENVMLYTDDDGTTRAFPIDYGLATPIKDRFIDSIDGPIAYKPPEIVQEMIVSDLLETLKTEYELSEDDMSFLKQVVGAEKFAEAVNSDDPRRAVIGMLQARNVEYKFFPNDVWALGIMLLEVFIYREPLNGPVNQDNIGEHLKNVIDSPIHRCPKGVKILIYNILKIKKEERISIDDVLDSKWFKGEEITEKELYELFAAVYGPDRPDLVQQQRSNEASGPARPDLKRKRSPESEGQNLSDEKGKKQKTWYEWVSSSFKPFTR